MFPVQSVMRNIEQLVKRTFGHEFFIENTCIFQKDILLLNKRL